MDRLGGELGPDDVTRQRAQARCRPAMVNLAEDATNNAPSAPIGAYKHRGRSGKTGL